ncbi:hypothetical protein M422DRAFT_786415 [Sphaerobolus stellatus SS14]|uniref:Uncharacterized protein n=1 Tax=Sphaerobolus stellatus (strain SS14) TaxID=990650 RepID=A0A0C9T1C0_SPHS4|nr:hypothetical protein M422DRAFT_786415 [Sphaerobolus stellatus SS14]
MSNKDILSPDGCGVCKNFCEVGLYMHEECFKEGCFVIAPYPLTKEEEQYNKDFWIPTLTHFLAKTCGRVVCPENVNHFSVCEQEEPCNCARSKNRYIISILWKHIIQLPHACPNHRKKSLKLVGSSAVTDTQKKEKQKQLIEAWKKKCEVEGRYRPEFCVGIYWNPDEAVIDCDNNKPWTPNPQ